MKRKHDVIDLTGDSEVENNVPTGRKSQGTYHATPPNSSNPGRTSQGRPTISQPSLLSQHRSQDEHDTWLLSQEQIDDNDIAREIDLTQEDDDDSAYSDYRLYGILNTKIVGIRFYTGRATIGEYVVIRREPSNPYDQNAIRIDNVVRTQIGHIGRQQAAKLAPYMDSGDLRIEGALTGQKREFDCPVALKLFGSNDPAKIEALVNRMKADKLPVTELAKAQAAEKKRQNELEKQKKAREKAAAAMRKQGGGSVIDEADKLNRYANLQPEGDGTMGETQLGEILSGTATFNPREIQNVANRLGHGGKYLEELPMAMQPEQVSTQLLPYQRQGLQWMLDHENPKLPDKQNGDNVQFWKKGEGFYTNIATSFSVSAPPKLASGGILADDMGLGKTIQVLSLIMADPNKDGMPTLIIAPLSVMSNWKNQAALHIKKRYALNVLIYHGQSQRGLAPEELTKYDLVVTTYQTMTLDLFLSNKSKDKPQEVPMKKGLFSITWRRVVLDEGHYIRNARAKMSRAAHSLMAKSRWILSGTPIVNSLKDLYSHVKFLRLSGGLSDFDIFNANIIRPVRDGTDAGKAILRALMQTLCLRRMKDMKFIDLKLPSLEFHKHNIKFTKHEQEKYDAFKAEAKGLVEEAKAKKGENTMVHLLEVLLRLRQTCNHWKMCGEDRVSKLLSLMEEGTIVDVIKPENKRALQDLLQLRIDSQEDCPICMESLQSRDHDPVITACAHTFCRDCIERTILTQKKCPMCRVTLDSLDLLVSPAPPLSDSPHQSFNEEDERAKDSSSKIKSLISLLSATQKETPSTKTVIFSQWTSFLDLLHPYLFASNLQFTRLDGRMNPTQRDASIDSLSTDPSCKIILCSLTACSTGINLTAANQVILADSWWAPAVEDQAVDRVYRLGQQRDVRVVRLVVEGTVEDEVLEVQAKKRKLVGRAFGEELDGDGMGRRGRERRERLGEIERLLR